jgi:type II secretory pathway component PulF
MTKAGIEPVQAFTKISQSQSRPEDIRTFSLRMAKSLGSGKSWSEALRFNPELPELDKALLISGAAAGRLEAHFQLLSQTYISSAKLQENIVKQLAYPILLLHLGILAFPSSQLALCFNHGALAYLKTKFLPLFILWFSILFPFWLWRQNQFSSLRQATKSLLDKIPFLAEATRFLSTARFFLALEGLVAAGFTPDKSWPLAARASGSQTLQEQVSAMVPQLRAGKSLREIFSAQSFSSAGCFLKETTLEQLGTAEISGQIESTLRRLHHDFSEKAEASFKALSEWIPRLVYFLAVIYSGYAIVHSFSESMQGVQSQLDQITDTSK